MHFQRIVAQSALARGRRRNGMGRPGSLIMADTPARIADLVLLSGRVITLDEPVREPRPWRSARGKSRRWGGTRRLGRGSARDPEDRLGQELVLPGFIEGHGHFVGLGESKEGSTDRSETGCAGSPWCVRRRPSRLRGDGSSPGWHQGKWQRTPEPNVEDIRRTRSSAARSPESAVVLIPCQRPCLLATPSGWKLAGSIGKLRPPWRRNPPRRRRAKATGLFREERWESSPPRSLDEKPNSAHEQDVPTGTRRSARGDECLANGVTSFHRRGSVVPDDRHLPAMAAKPVAGPLYVMIREPTPAWRSSSGVRMIGVGNHHLTVRAVKELIDGALGTHGAMASSAL